MVSRTEWVGKGWWKGLKSNWPWHENARLISVCCLRSVFFFFFARIAVSFVLVQGTCSNAPFLSLTLSTHRSSAEFGFVAMHAGKRKRKHFTSKKGTQRVSTLTKKKHNTLHCGSVLEKKFLPKARRCFFFCTLAAANPVETAPGQRQNAGFFSQLVKSM